MLHPTRPCFFFRARTLSGCAMLPCPLRLCPLPSPAKSSSRSLLLPYLLRDVVARTAIHPLHGGGAWRPCSEAYAAAVCRAPHSGSTGLFQSYHSARGEGCVHDARINIARIEDQHISRKGMESDILLLLLCGLLQTSEPLHHACLSTTDQFRHHLVTLAIRAGQIRSG